MPARAVHVASEATRLRGRSLVVARAAWVAIVLATLSIVATGIPVAFRQALTLSGESRSLLAQIGLPAHFPATVLILADFVMLSGFALLASLLFWRRSDDPMALFVALMLVLMGVMYTAPVLYAAGPVWLGAGVIALGETCEIIFLYLFPNGRFVPRWIGWIVLPLFLWRLLAYGLVYLPSFRTHPPGVEYYGALALNPIDVLGGISLHVAGVVSQVYRYRRLSTPLERQQAKWLLFGAGVAIVVVGSILLAGSGLWLGPLPGPAAPFAVASVRVLGQLVLLVVPAVLTVSILRYRLFEIDVLINRALVYSVLTVVLLLVYSGGVIVLQQVVGLVTGESEADLAVVGSTLAIAALFQPMRRRVQHAIDRRFYRRRYDARHALERFAATVRGEVELDALIGSLVDVVDETVQPAHVSLWLPPAGWSGERRHEGSPSPKR